MRRVIFLQAGGSELFPPQIVHLPTTPFHFHHSQREICQIHKWKGEGELTNLGGKVPRCKLGALDSIHSWVARHESTQYLLCELMMVYEQDAFQPVSVLFHLYSFDKTVIITINWVPSTTGIIISQFWMWEAWDQGVGKAGLFLSRVGGICLWSVRQSLFHTSLLASACLLTLIFFGLWDITPFMPLSLHSSPRAHIGLWFSPFYKDTSHTGIRSVCMTSF